ncbi:G-patch domain-containing protein [Cardiosporidium cionae]|uniref:G-patch domain-containing protein n=1 Tax=Cardiosporidium cionae TaxID=476202 RepID=A0ABQ7JEF9_9APIC|nr:G-patch domain-containing protein [Cardiosporidium cionae]|eukprot:KAF8822269.1 G-patch domain-containing protein [Cardiosporidium cionae]
MMMSDSLYGETSSGLTVDQLPPPTIPSESITAIPTLSSSGGAANAGTNRSTNASLLGSLYGDLTDDSQDEVGIAAAAWSAHRSKILAPVIVRKREAATSLARNNGKATKTNFSTGVSTASITASPSSNSVLPSSTNVKEIIAQTQNLLSGIKKNFTSSSKGLASSPAFSQQSGTNASHFSAPTRIGTFIGTTTISSLHAKGTDEYDPSKPHEYDKIVRERLQRKQQEEVERRQQQQLEDEQKECQKREKELLSTSSSKLNLRVSGEEAFLRRGQLSSSRRSAPMSSGTHNEISSISPSTNNFSSAAEPPLLQPSHGDSKKSVAARMMEKMGWKHGEGLGREKQGMTGILIARKTDKRTGVIVQGTFPQKNDGAPTDSNPPVIQATQFNRPPTRVVLLNNLVGAGDVDEDLQEEIQDEASKFGNLLKVKIFEAQNIADDQAVRIFCVYESSVQATKALVAMNGRVFGGRIVRARFYDENRFEKDDLSPGSDEI